MRDTYLPFSPPDLGEEEIEAVVAALRSGWITTGPRVAEFEERFTKAVDGSAGLALNSCTGALHVALAAVGVGPGDAVFVPAMTFCATANVVEHLGATPVIVDVDPETLNLDPTALARAVEDVAPGLRPRAVMPVHYAGHPVDMPVLIDIAERAGLAIVEDAAHALPAAVDGVPVGHTSHTSVPHAVAFSFYATKNLTTGEGGALVGDPDLIEEARLWALHGMSRDAWKRYEAAGSWFYEVVRAGFKYNLTDPAAALGLVQLGRLPDLHRRRVELVDRYQHGLAGLDGLELPVARPGIDHAWHLFVVRLRLEEVSIDRAEVIDALAAENIGTSVHFIPLHLHPYYRDKYQLHPADLPVASREYERLITLPLYTRMTDADCDDVIEAVRRVVETHHR